eukprot:1161371-Pelagomonas_calceolata.AAC.7
MDSASSLKSLDGAGAAQTKGEKDQVEVVISSRGLLSSSGLRLPLHVQSQKQQMLMMQTPSCPVRMCVGGIMEEGRGQCACCSQAE